MVTQRAVQGRLRSRDPQVQGLFFLLSPKTCALSQVLRGGSLRIGTAQEPLPSRAHRIEGQGTSPPEASQGKCG